MFISMTTYILTTVEATLTHRWVRTIPSHSTIVRGYDQEIPQSQTADKPVASWGRATKYSRDTRKANKAKQRGLSSPSVEAQWLRGRVFDSRPKGCRFEPHRRHCIVVLEQDTLYPSLALVQPRKIRSYITERLFMGRKESNQTNKNLPHRDDWKTRRDTM